VTNPDGVAADMLAQHAIGAMLSFMLDSRVSNATSPPC